MNRGGRSEKFKAQRSKNTSSSRLQGEGVGRHVPRMCALGGLILQHHAGFALGLLSLAAWFISPASTPANAAVAKDTKEEKKPEPPRVVVTLPLAVRSGMTNKLTIRGQNLTNVVQLRFTNDGTKVEASIISTGKADVPKEADAKKIGDTQIELAGRSGCSCGRQLSSSTASEGSPSQHTSPIRVTAARRGRRGCSTPCPTGTMRRSCCAGSCGACQTGGA